MISMKNISPENASSEYYDKEGYYTPGSEEAKEASKWFGQGAKDAGLVGEVDGKTFTQLLEGVAPDGQLMGRIRDGERDHRPGLDMTFSAPKSASVVALVMGDDRLIKAHDKAVQTVMTYIEENFATTRVGRNGVVEQVQSPHLIAGLFRHETSRKLDPQLHTHAVVANMVKVDLGDKYRAIHTDPISNNVRVLTQLYHNVLFHETKGLGYDTELTRDGFFNIKGLGALPELYSKRSKQMAAALEERGLEPTGASKQMAALITRDAKRNADRGDLDPIWAKEAEGVGWTKERMDAFVAQAKSKTTAPEREEGDGKPSQDGSKSAELAAAHADVAKGLRSETKTDSAREAVDFAIRHISEREALYSISELKAVALSRTQTPDLKSIDIEVNQLVEAKRLYTVDTPKGRYASDDVTIAAERDIIRQFRKSGHDTGVDIASSTRFKFSVDRTPETAIGRRLDFTILTDGQKDAIKLALLGEGRFVGIQGYAGTGKTTMMEFLNKYAERYGYTVEGLAPTLSATGKLAEVLPNANTIQSRILDIKNERNLDGDPSKTILIVDEASMASSVDMQTLMRHANQAGYARVVLMGDILQLESPSAGIPFKSLQRAGMPTALMDDIQRQTNERAKEAVIHAMRGEVESAFKKIAQLETTDNIRAEVANQFLSRSIEARKETGVLVLTNAAREGVNEEIRVGLRAEGTLKGPEVTAEVIKPLHFTRAQSGDAGSYRDGDTLISIFALKAQGIEAHDVLTVLNRDIEANRIEVRNEYSGEVVTLTLGQKSKAAASLIAFEEGKRSFAAGDLVRFAIHDPNMDLQKGVRGTIQKVDSNAAHVEMASGETRIIPLDTVAGRGMDHAYALTAHAMQGDDTKDIIAGISYRERLASQKALYVAMSRAKNAVTLVTDHASKLIGKISRNSGESLEALEKVTVQRIEDLGGSYSRDTAKSAPEVDFEQVFDILKDRQVRDQPAGKDDSGTSQNSRPEGKDTDNIRGHEAPSERSQNGLSTPHNYPQPNGTDGPHTPALNGQETTPETERSPLVQNGQNDRSEHTEIEAKDTRSKEGKTERENGRENTPDRDDKNGGNKDQNGTSKTDEKEVDKDDPVKALEELNAKAAEMLEERSRGRDERSR